MARRASQTVQGHRRWNVVKDLLKEVAVAQRMVGMANAEDAANKCDRNAGTIIPRIHCAMAIWIDPLKQALAP